MRGPNPQRVGRYLLFDEIGSGGMASVYLGKLVAPGGFSRTVALKRLHPHLAKQPEFVGRLLDEARITCAIRHPNVGQTLDVVATDGEILLVLEYVHGESLARLLRQAAERGSRIDPAIACAIVAGALHGLHAAHEATTEDGHALEIVHRDVSPQNILVGFDGVVRVVDFGIARSLGRVMVTQDGALRGKLAYMSPEQARGLVVDRRTDIYAASIVLWEALAGRRLHTAPDGHVMLEQILQATPPPLDVQPSLSELVVRGLAREPQARFQTAQEMALALERAQPLASTSRVAEWIEGLVGSSLRDRGHQMARVEQHNVASSEAISPSDGTETRSAIVLGPRPAAHAIVSHVPALGDSIARSEARKSALQRHPRLMSLGAVLVGCVLTLAIMQALKVPVRHAPATGVVVAVATSPEILASSLPSARRDAQQSPPLAPTLPLAGEGVQPGEELATIRVSAAPPRIEPPPATTLRPSARPQVGLRPKSPRHTSGTTASTARASSVAVQNCDPPYTFDEENRRHFKRECLQ